MEVQEWWEDVKMENLKNKFTWLSRRVIFWIIIGILIIVLIDFSLRNPASASQITNTASRTLGSGMVGGC